MVRVGIHNLGDRTHYSWIESACERVVGIRKGEWEVVVMGVAGSARWAVKVRGPAGFRYQIELLITERNTESLERLLMQAMTAYDSIN